MSFLHPHSRFPEYCEDVELAIWWRDNYPMFLRCLVQPKYHKPAFNSTRSGNLLIYPPKCYTMENEMNGRKSKGHGDRLGSGNDKSAAFQWINISLTSEDLDLLEREEASLEQLAFAYVSLGMLGLGLSIKYDSVGKSYSVSIYGRDSRNNNKPCGISGAASDLRDALLVSLFRFNNGLQGSFDGCTNSDTTIQSKRFR